MADDFIRGTNDFQVPEYFNFADVIDEWAQKEEEGKRQSDNPALWWIDGDGNEVKWSFQDVALKSKRTANLLSTSGDIKPGDRVMGILPAIPEYWLIQAACLRTGAAFLILPVNVGPNEVHRRILQSKPACVVAASCDMVNSELLNVVDQITTSCQVNVRCRILVNRMQHEQREGWLSFEKFFQTASADYQSVKSLSSAPCLICFTTGTTGNAKMIEHSQASMGLGGTGLRKYRFEETDVCWTALFTGWVWLTHDSFFSTWSVGAGTFACYKKMSPKEAMSTLQRYPITQVTFPPYIYKRALEEEILGDFNFPKLRRCYIGGEPINMDVICQWKEQTGVELWNHYGLSEMSDVCLLRDPEDEQHIGSVGKPFPGIDILVVDENDQEVPHGTLGRVVIRAKPYRPVGLFTHYVVRKHSQYARFH